MKKHILSTLFIFVSLLFSTTNVSAQNIPTAQEASGVQSQQNAIDTQKMLQEQITSQPAKPMLDDVDVVQDDPAPPQTGETILIKDIKVVGATLLNPVEVNEVITPYIGQELSVREMQEVANKITQLYRENGYITSRAFLPPQRIENNILEVHVAEGLLGSIDVRGNRWFSSALIKKKIALKEGAPLNYDTLRANLRKLNEKPDRNVRTVLAPGQTPGTTDLILNVEDKMPIHLGLSYDNFGSRYIGDERLQATLTHNNLLGFDDILTLQFQSSDEGVRTYSLTSLRYLFPLTHKTQLGFYAGETELTLGQEFRTLLARGKSDLVSVFMTHHLISRENFDLKINAGFDFKDILNFQLNVESSRDRLRVAKLGFNIDRTDAKGRTIINNDVHFGIPNFLGGLKSVDALSSRAGAGGKFSKNVLDVLRLQNMPWRSSLLIKGQSQWASRTLVAAEQYQIGGIANVRAYPPGEFSGDNGQSFTAEWSFPLYFLSKKIKYPFSNLSVHDSLKISAFYDWGRVETRTPAVGAEDSTVLSGAGVGVRVNLPGDFFIRVDVAWPLTHRVGSDDDHARTWFQVTKEF